MHMIRIKFFWHRGSIIYFITYSYYKEVPRNYSENKVSTSKKFVKKSISISLQTRQNFSIRLSSTRRKTIFFPTSITI